MLRILLLHIGIGTFWFFVHVKFSSASDIGSTPVHLKGSYFKERQEFESLLAAGRTITFPYATGLILSAFSSLGENWPISLTGLNGILDLSPNQLLNTYTETTQFLKQDDHVTHSGSLYLLQNWKGNLTSNSSSALNKLGIGLKHIKWDKETYNSTWELLDYVVNEKTNNLLNGRLIPKDSEIGNPFRFSTQALLLSTFHYKKDWRKPWKSAGLAQFGSENVKNVPYLRTEGEFLFSDSEDYSAISISLEGGEKSVVFILPKISLTQYLKQQISTRNKKAKAKAGIGEADSDEDGDFVPIPRRWEKRDLSIHIPSIHLTVADQYGKELVELGMNETFCTTIHDRRGAIPYYLRPIVQLNAITLSDIKVEIASASGTALEKFYFGTDLSGVGYPKSSASSSEQSDGEGRKSWKIIKKSKSEKRSTGNEKISNVISGQLKNLNNYPNSMEDETEKYFSDEATTPTTPFVGDTGFREQFVFNRPFLWYLDDARLGPLVYGIVERTENMMGAENPEEDSKFSEEVQRYLMWSCRSFKQSGEISG